MHISTNQETNEESFFKIDNKQLEKEQIQACKQEGNYLVSAPAGSGKTLTIVGKVKYLIKQKQVDPSQILVLAFTDKVVQELKERIYKEIENDEVDIKTFHKYGLDLIKQFYPQVHVNPNGFYSFLPKFYENCTNWQSDENKCQIFYNGIISTLNYYYQHDELEYNYNYYKMLQYMYQAPEYSKENFNIIIQALLGSTINNEKLNPEKTKIYTILVANLLANNNIKYQLIDNDKTIRADLPDQTLFFTTEYSSKRYPSFYIPTPRSATIMQIRELREKLENQNIIKIYNEDKKEDFEKENELFIKTHKWYHQKKIRNNLNDAFKIIYNNNYSDEELIYFKDEIIPTNNFTKQKQKECSDIINLLILLKDEYLQYENQNNDIDFDQMILGPKHIIQTKCNPKNFKYKYFIIDEYQDISKPRFELIKESLKINKGNIIGFGDDWQSIYAFAGSNNNYFTNFNKYVDDGIILKLSRTYRLNQNLANITKDIVIENENQIDKSVISNKKSQTPIEILCFERSNVDAFLYALEEIKNIEKEKEITFMILARTNRKLNYIKECNQIIHSTNQKNVNNFEIFKPNNQKYANINIIFSSVHRAKGLEADYVMILSADKYAFPYYLPSQETNLIQYISYPLNEFATEETEDVTAASLTEEEERRLFYVALTRSKNKVFININENKELTPFLSKVINKYKNNIEEIEIPAEDLRFNTQCPLCGGFMIPGFRNRLTCENCGQKK